MVLEMEGKWPYSCCFVGCCFQDLFNIVRNILVQFSSSFFSIRLISIYAVHPFSSIDATAAWKKSRLISSDRNESNRSVLNIIRLEYLIPYICVQIICIGWEYLIPYNCKLFVLG